MTTATPKPPPVTDIEEANITETPDFAGHPRGLGTLFFTELWERFSYYGMRSILILYMTSAAAAGGLGMSVPEAAGLYGTYTMAVYLTALPGGLIADYLTGARLAVFIGGVIIAAGHFSMAFHSTTTFYLGLGLIAIGTGLLKPNISVMVGGLYRENDPRRDSGFSIFYMGINLGAFLAPLIVGYLAKGESFKTFLSSMGMDPAKSWHWGFAAAGVGMVFGLIIYLLNRRQLARVGTKVKTVTKGTDATGPGTAAPLTRDDWKRIAAIFIFFVFTILFWAAYEQKGASLNLFADRLVRTEIFGITFPAPYLQSLTPLFVIMLTPVFAILWVRLRERQPSSPGKFTLGLLLIGLAYVLIVPAAMLTAQGRVSFWWLVGLYFLEVCGEMCLSPVGLSTVTKLSPPKLVGIMMGVWFLAAALGNKLAGFLSSFFVSNDSWRLTILYGGIAAGLLVSVGILAMFTPTIKRLMGNVR
ncbi:MAG TPA: peptide MFS transporter [Pyrinomonadaceae bacterium]|jgi:POT family proton-dependent oligopeptide transporter|nr:peptide MFS transporter [Pyrinomonadaceae bacterium]